MKRLVPIAMLVLLCTTAAFAYQAGDLNEDESVDLTDLRLFAAQWLETPGCFGTPGCADLIGNDTVDLLDMALFAKSWMHEPTLVINEFMASNDSALEDPDESGEYPDWIEIYNYGTDSVDMAGMELNDSTNTYVIPAGVTIADGEYKIFYADDDDEQGPRHTNYKLDASGDEIYLFNKNGVLIDSRTYSQTQLTDYSFGRYPDNTDDWYTMETSTPGATNQAGITGDVWFSKLSGTFTSTFTLELSTESPSASIRYTTNGSKPTQSSNLYASPLSISNSSTSMIRARAYEPSLAPSPIQSHYYIPLASDIQNFSSNLPIVIIDSYGENIDNNGTLGKWSRDYDYQPVASVFIDIDKDTGVASTTDVPNFAGRAGSRIRGESTRGWVKRQYSLELWDDYDIDEAASLLGMPTESDWILNAPFGDKTLLRNVLAYKWANDIGEGFAAPRTKFVEVFYNQNGGNCSYADYRGVYVLIEKIKVSDSRLDIAKLDPTDTTAPDITGGYVLRIDKDNGQETFPAPTMIGSPQYYDPDEFELVFAQKQYIQNFIDQFETDLVSGDFNNPAAGYAQHIDIESFIEYDIIAEIFKNADTFTSSVYFYKERDGKLHFGPQWDYNFSSGNATHAGWEYPLWFPKATTTFEGWTNYYFRPANGWHSRLMDDADYMLKTADKWFEHREDKLSDAQINTDIDDYYSLLTTNVPPTSDPNNPASRNFDKYPILNQYEWCNYYYGGNPSQNGGIPHTYQMEVEWLRNWFNGQGTPAPGESYSIYSEYSDRMGNLDDFWLADRDIDEPPDLKINNVVTNTGGTVAPGDSLKMSGPSGTIYYTTDGTDPREWTYVNGGGGVVSGGAVSASAQTYSSSITLNKTTQIKARIKNGSDWTALNEAIFSMNNVAPNLRITEIMYHPVDPNDEFIEFKNIGGSTINLAHCELTKGVNLVFPDMTLASGAYTVAVRSIAEFNGRYPGYSGTIAGEYTGNKLDNGGENIRLKDAAGNIIQEFDYEDGWFPITDGKGFSLNIIDPADPVPANWNKRLSWQASNVSGGTPGDSHIANAVANDAIVINEVLTHTDDLVYGDWIELYNTSGSPVNISNWYLSDDIDNLKRYRIAAGTAPIPAGGYKVFTSISHFRNSGDSGALVRFGLSEHGEKVFLTSGNGSDISGGYSIGENFGPAHNDVSFGRYTKGAPTYNVDFVQMTSQTRGAVNPIAPYVPDVVITEIMYNPQNIQDLLGEYIELYNRSGSTVYLYDVANPSNTWQFTKGIDLAFPTGASIAAGERILISRANPDTFKFANGISGVQVFGPFENYTELANDGEKIELSMPGIPDPGTGFVSYIRLEQVNYSDGAHPLVGDPWPTGADARGDSLQRSSVSSYSNDVSNWTAATPTPGS